MIEQYCFTKMIPNYYIGEQASKDAVMKEIKREMVEELVEKFSDIKIETSDRGGYTIVKAKIGIDIPETRWRNPIDSTNQME